MSGVSTTINNNLNSCLSNKDKNIYIKSLNSNKTETNLTSNYKNKIYNKIEYAKKKLLHKYNNIHIFNMREKRLEDKKKKLNLRIKKNSSEIKKCDENLLSTQCSIYITQNLSEQLIQLPSILDKIKGLCHTELNWNNNKKSKIKSNKNKIILPKKERFTPIEINQPIKALLLNTIKKRINKKDKAKKRIKSEDNLYKKKEYDLNLYKKQEDCYLTYIDNFHDYLHKKNLYSLRKERYIEIEQINKNKIDLIKDKIKELNKSQKLLDDEFTIKIQEYLTSLYKEKERQDKKDIILCTKIYELRNHINILDKRLKKLLNIKNTYIKWILFQIQVKDKLLKLPDKYQEYLNINNNKKLPIEFATYLKKAIFETPQELINRIQFYENKNIKSLEIYHKKTLEIYPLKDELEEQIKTNKRFSNEEEINKLNGLVIKLKSQNEILTKKLKYLKKELNILPKKNIKRTNYTKIFEKIIALRNIITNNKIVENKKIKEIEILLMLKEIESEYYLLKKKNEYYSSKYKNEIKIAKDKREKEKRIEKIILNKNLIDEKKKLLRKNIIDRANKLFIIPKIKVNWNIYNLKKIRKISINKNILGEDNKEDLDEFLSYK